MPSILFMCFLHICPPIDSDKSFICIYSICRWSCWSEAAPILPQPGLEQPAETEGGVYSSAGVWRWYQLLWQWVIKLLFTVKSVKKYFRQKNVVSIEYKHPSSCLEIAEMIHNHHVEKFSVQYRAERWAQVPIICSIDNVTWSTSTAWIRVL